MRQITIPIYRHRLSVTWDPNRFTPDLGRRLTEAIDAADPAAMEQLLPDALSTLIITWDLVDDDGAPVPIEEEVLSELPVLFLQNILDGLIDDGLPLESTRDRSPTPGSVDDAEVVECLRRLWRTGPLALLPGLQPLYESVQLVKPVAELLGHL